jgi:predicted O-methyltransferase YrrM
LSGSSDPRAALFRLIWGFTLSQALYAVAKLGVADVMRPGEPLPVADIATRVGADADALYRILRALAAEGLFREGPERAFRLTQTGEVLRDDIDGTMRYVAIMNAEQLYPVWTHVLEVVRSGAPATEQLWGKSHFDRLAERPEEAEIFNRAMAGGAAIRFATLLALDWSAIRIVVDIGGGTGGILLRLLAREPHLHGILFDLPHLADEARAAIAAAGLDDRCEFVGGSFFETIPANGDAYLLAQVLHDWDDADSTRILRACRAAIADGSRLVVLEQIVPDGNEPHPSKLLDLHMLVVVGGRERSEAEFRDLLAAGGFRLQRIIEGPRACALEAVPV